MNTAAVHKARQRNIETIEAEQVTSLGCIKAHLHQHKAKTKAKILSDVCRLFYDIFYLFLDHCLSNEKFERLSDPLDEIVLFVQRRNGTS